MSNINDLSKVLVLCQREYGTRNFNQDHIKRIHKDIITLRELTGDNKKPVIEYLTKGIGHPYDKMTFKLDFDHRNIETNIFISKNIENKYSYIIIGYCPYFIFSKENVNLLSKILKENGLLIFSPSDGPEYTGWFENVRQNFETFFNIIFLEPKIIMQKIQIEKQPNVIDLISHDEDHEKVGNRFKSKKASRKSKKASRKSRKASRKSKKASRKSKKASRKSRKVSRKSRKTSRKSRKASRKSRKASSKSRKASRKSRKTSSKSRKASRKSRKASSKSRKVSRKSRK
jgi:hypothetical protein